MATPSSPSHPGPDHMVTVKVLYNDSNRRFKLPLKELKAQVFPQMLRTLLGVPADVNVILERYSDSAGSYIRLDCDNIAVYKQLYRAAKAKSKLRIKVSKVTVPSPTVTEPEMSSEPSAPAEEPSVPEQPRYSFLETVLSPADLQARSQNPPLIDSTPIPKSLPIGQPRYRNFELDQEKHHFPLISHNSVNGMFCIDCNNCGRSIANEHYHCSICENGDYDMCPRCVEDGSSCGGDGHWLIKRFVQDGVVTNSTTETIPPRNQFPIKSEVITKPHVPVKAEVVQVQALPETMPEPVLKLDVKPSESLDAAVQGEEKPMCNGCCREADGSYLVRCNDCEDYDLCLRCLLRDKHGHHPGHTFHLGSDRNFSLKDLITSRCLPGRQFRHAAVCDGCDRRIVGVRHKCLACPDWDFCPECIATAPENHPGHRFVKIYDTISEAPREHEIHYGIFCDGPLCKNKPAQSYITGVRYKCAVCDDCDFCASCEALPTDHHNRTHPLVKFKTPVRSVTVSTLGDDGSKGALALGDRCQSRTWDSAAVDEQEPVEVDAKSVEMPKAFKPEVEAASSSGVPGYNAEFLKDTIEDGTIMKPGNVFSQTWTLVNNGHAAWPVGCDVRYVGGDAMFDVDTSHPSDTMSLYSAQQSNKLFAPVEPGESADFTVNLRAPERECNVTSYWRLKLPNGMAVGHSLWCEIEVQEPVPAMVEESPVSEIGGSGMIFPKLEKESPESSTIQEAPAPLAPTLSNSSEVDVEDVESLALDDASTDAGFLTDEEYDVLDASDQEYLEAKQSAN
ncbi:hypothetical protein N7499_004864 [Penicillium canescens]|uniref:ZZ-type domain-containing protein n=1 Tax=Penicillium canescens TaxID=5083 RepID=A0AAD6I1Z1_PENCN|nr:hypothetical protein N7522_004753 [Penicillium canescens]KAJ6026764.1 hypothetical protein N7460_011581 [Penicillium canescens]KAJ6085235.1 hypothetical protein N7499_004864 [Penicillium canescens]KAJ6162015.1 hypothetical protein N7485_010245 [Penicillium canescens]